ncbi:acyltransferase family protein [Parapedobacter koreensis]|uniref:Predicted acyltransferase n=1 Tax=Parapedobacter koreensis TaxID=332977 RepID=A0A1H7PE90_9SPHI|nr:DUF5009 domain-containing protein [Parapedobacter koreensis]SEL33959.1 Predicted acyltransferase [Parapedobacter koreensis]
MAQYTNSDATGRGQSRQRLVSLDAFRGFTVAAMIIVNTPASWNHVFPPLLHATWHGITPTDCVFPFFIFIVGIAITLSYDKLKATGASTKQVVWKTLKRASVIFLLGIFLGLFPEFNFSEIRVAGVLQRIALVFLACAFLFWYTNWKQQALIGAVVLVVYWMAMVCIPVPGVGMGLLEPGKNLAAWVDNMLMPGRMWQGTWDPEGLLSTLPAVATGISGMLIGRLIANPNVSREQKVAWMYLLGLSAFVLGSVWGWVFPINKNLWTSPYVLYTSGLASMVLASLFFVIEVLGVKKWATVGVIFGSNAIVAYVLGSIIPSVLAPLNNWYVMNVVEGRNWAELASLLWAVGVCFLCYIPIYLLYRKKIFVRI